MLNYIEQEHIKVYQLETSNENTIHYLPYHAVKKTKLKETKFRIIFDASSQDPRMPALNDTLEVGPNLLPETVGCLLRFQMHEFAITGDGQQAFLQLSLHKKNRDATKFFWYNLLQKTFTNEITTNSFTRPPFGLACSPFLLCVATRELASKHMKDFLTATSMLGKNLYMDDFVASVEIEPQIITLHR
ncbi:integrase catalytic domain-containing protein [Trichonephila clavipes]|nr:integrase catalytic domain-containing protein [Trichonephila clavipes]